MPIGFLQSAFQHLFGLMPHQSLSYACLGCHGQQHWLQLLLWAKLAVCLLFIAAFSNIQGVFLLSACALAKAIAGCLQHCRHAYMHVCLYAHLLPQLSLHAC